MVPAGRHTEITARADGRRVDGVKMVTGPSLLGKRFQSELEAVRGLVQKAARSVAVNGGAAAAPIKAGKKKRLLAAKAPAAAAAAATAAPKKKRLLAAEAPAAAAATATPKKKRLLVAEAPAATGREGGAAKRMKTSHVVVEVIEPRMSKAEREHLVASLSSLSLDLPSHITEFMQRKCGAHIDGDEMEINLDSAGDASLLQLKKLVDEFAVEYSKKRLEVEPEPRKDDDAAAAGAMSEDEFVDICGDAAPVVAEKKLPDTTGGHRPSSSSRPHRGDLPMDLAAAAAAETPQLKIAPVQAKKLDRAAPPAPAPAGRIGDLVAKAQQKKRRCLRDVERKRAREELLEVERTAVPDRVHPEDMVRFHLAEVEHVVSSGDKISPVRLLGLVMK